MDGEGSRGDLSTNLREDVNFYRSSECHGDAGTRRGALTGDSDSG